MPAPAVELVVVEDIDARATREHEATETAVVVRRLHDEEGFAWGEIVVLFRARTGIDLYDRALRASGAPTVLIGGNVFAEHEQVADVLALLALVENPHDEEQLVRALASPYVAASDDDLFALREAAGSNGALWDAVSQVPALRSFGAELAELRARRAELPLGALVEACLAFRDYELAALGLADGAARSPTCAASCSWPGATGRCAAPTCAGSCASSIGRRPGGRPGRGRSGRRAT